MRRFCSVTPRCVSLYIRVRCQIQGIDTSAVMGFAPGAHARETRRAAGWRLGRACLPLNEWPASASNAAEFMYHPAAPFALVKRTFAANPTSVTRLPRSPSRFRYRFRFRRDEDNSVGERERKKCSVCEYEKKKGNGTTVCATVLTSTL